MPQLKLTAMLSLNKTGFDAGMQAAQKSVDRFAGGFKSQFAALFSAAAVTGFVKSIINLGGEVKDMSERLAVSAKDAQEFSLAAKLGGQDAGTFAKAIEKVRLAMVEGVGTGKNPLAQFGITIDELRKGDAPGILRKLAVELDNFAGSADQTKALVDVFGAKGAGSVINMLKELENSKSSFFLTDEEVDRLDRAGDAMAKLWTNIQLLGAQTLNNIMAGGYAFRTSTPKPIAPPVEATGEQVEQQAKAEKELAKMREETDAINEKNRIAQLTDEERMNELLAERIELVHQLSVALTDQARDEIRNKLARNEAGILTAQGKGKPADLFSENSSGGITTSALGQIGAFTGTGPQAQFAAAQKESLAMLRQINDGLMSKGIVVRDVAPR